MPFKPRSARPLLLSPSEKTRCRLKHLDIMGSSKIPPSKARKIGKRSSRIKKLRKANADIKRNLQLKETFPEVPSGSSEFRKLREAARTTTSLTDGDAATSETFVKEEKFVPDVGAENGELSQAARTTTGTYLTNEGVDRINGEAGTAATFDTEENFVPIVGAENGNSDAGFSIIRAADVYSRLNDGVADTFPAFEEIVPDVCMENRNNHTQNGTDDEDYATTIQQDEDASVSLIDEDPLNLFADPFPAAVHHEIGARAKPQQSSLEEENYLLRQQVESLKRELRILKSTLCFKDLESEELLYLYTGLKTKKTFMFLLSLFDNASFQFDSKDGVWLPRREQLLLTLIKLRLNLSHRDLGFRFKISPKSVANILKTWQNLLYVILVPQFLKSLHVRSKKSSCRLFLDYVEINTCENINSQIRTPNPNNQLHSLKGLIGMTPDSVVTFVTKLQVPFNKNSVDVRQIIKKLVPRDLIIADKGIQISHLLPVGVLINTRQIPRAHAKARTNVERGIRRIKMYKMLNVHSTWTYPQYSKLFEVCAALTNLEYIHK